MRPLIWVSFPHLAVFLSPIMGLVVLTLLTFSLICLTMRNLASFTGGTLQGSTKRPTIRRTLIIPQPFRNRKTFNCAPATMSYKGNPANLWLILVCY